MSRKSEQFKGITADVFWGAAAYAHRIQGGEYKKVDRPAFRGTDLDGVEYEEPALVSNRTHAKHALDNTALISAEDYAYGRKVRSYFKGLSFKALMGKLNDFESNVLKFVDVENFEEDKNAAYHFAIVCSLPASYERSIKRENVDARIRDANSKHFGNVKERLNLDIEIIRRVFSDKWGTFFLTAQVIGGEHKGNIVFFSYRNGIDPGTCLRIAGTVKGHRDEGQTQLNRVKVEK